jgi:hypothetical protein
MSVVAAVPVAAASPARIVRTMSLVWVGLDLQALTECEDDKGYWQSEYRETN